MKSTIRNSLAGEVVEIISGGAVSEVEVKTAAGIVSAVITTRSLNEAGIKVGDRVVARMKATAVSLDKP